MSGTQSPFDALDRDAQDAYGFAGRLPGQTVQTYWLGFCQRVIAGARKGRVLFRACDRFRVLVDTFEAEWIGGTEGGLDRLSDQEWLNLRPRVTEAIRAAAKAASDAE